MGKEKEPGVSLARFWIECGFTKELGFRQWRIRLRRKNPGCVDLPAGGDLSYTSLAESACRFRPCALIDRKSCLCEGEDDSWLSGKTNLMP